ncbi:hypothetical protein IEQ34_011405 [Dendrobium chrysotoxum]|uniref:Secreted protein n=1 Tax=Dendrobium chrysotoxum TaxID=161865 RepID=A0AAV7GPS6_DENCH|nr:hypothetical protein IEQ34_011405 [Dendrobium chrysotoxum]
MIRASTAAFASAWSSSAYVDIPNIFLFLRRRAAAAPEKEQDDDVPLRKLRDSHIRPACRLLLRHSSVKSTYYSNHRYVLCLQAPFFFNL